LIEKYARNPLQVRIEQKALTVPTVEQVYYEVDRRYKIDLLTRLIDIHDLKLGIIFCNTKRMVDDLVDHLNAQGYSADRLHGDMTQMMRDRVMQKFRKSGLDFLVATDVAARGIDVDDVEVVFNYDLPYDGRITSTASGAPAAKGAAGAPFPSPPGARSFRFATSSVTPTCASSAASRPPSMKWRRRGPLFFLTNSAPPSRAANTNATIISSNACSKKALPPPTSPPPSSIISRPATPPPPKPRRARRNTRAPPARAPALSRVPAGPRRRTPRPPRPILGTSPGTPRRSTASAYTRARCQTAGSCRAQTPASSARARARRQTGGSCRAQTPAPAGHPPAAAKLPSEPVEPKPAFKPKSPRKTQPFQTRLWMNVGEEMGIVPIDIVNTIAGETGLPGNVVGTVDIRPRHLFADVAAEHANAIIAKLNRTQIKGHKLKVKVA